MQEEGDVGDLKSAGPKEEKRHGKLPVIGPPNETGKIKNELGGQERCKPGITNRDGKRNNFGFCGWNESGSFEGCPLEVKKGGGHVKWKPV